MSRQNKKEDIKTKNKFPRRHNQKTGRGGFGPEGRRGSLQEDGKFNRVHVASGVMNCT